MDLVPCPLIEVPNSRLTEESQPKGTMTYKVELDQPRMEWWKQEEVIVQGKEGKQEMKSS
eukprot:14552741-Ditylum_brightwellii.AAC.1